MYPNYWRRKPPQQPLRPPSLAITKADSPDPVAPGGLLTYNLVVTNPASGSATATNVFVTETLPAEVTFSLATPSQGSYDSGTNVWTVGTVGTTGSATLDLVVTVNSDTPDGTVLTNTAVVASDQFDPNLANNTVITETTVTSVQALKATVATVIHLPDHTPAPCAGSACVGRNVPAGTSVHDLAKVTSNDSTKTPEGRVKFAFFAGNHQCEGKPAKVETVELDGNAGVATAESHSTKPLAAGDYSFQARYAPNKASQDLGFRAKTSKCEPLRVHGQSDDDCDDDDKKGKSSASGVTPSVSGGSGSDGDDCKDDNHGKGEKDSKK